MKRFVVLVCVASATMTPAMLFRFFEWDASPLLETAIFGAAVLAAGFMLSWGAEAAENYVSQGLILAVVALITVLPEYAIDLYYAFQAGRAPESNYVHYAAANMTGANRLLVGLAWPLMLLLHWWRTRNRAITLAPVNVIEIVFLLIASLYAFVILFKNRIDLLDFIVLVSIFGAYLWQVGRVPKMDSDHEDEVVSDKINQWTLLVGMLPLAMSFGASSIIALPLDARQHEEFFLTAAQSLFALSLLIRLRFALWAASVLMALFYRAGHDCICVSQ